MSLQICRHLCSLWFLLSWRIILSCRVIWSYCLMCIISNADQSLRNVPTSWNIVDFFLFFLNRSILGSVFNLIDVFNLPGSERTSRLIAAVRSFTSVCFCVSSLRKYEFYLWIQCFGLKSTVCNNLLFVFKRPIQFVSVQFKGQQLTDKNLYEEVYLYRLIVHLFCSGVLLGVTIKSVFKAPVSPCGFLLSHLFTTSQTEGLLEIFFDYQMAEKIITPLVSVHLKEQFTQKSDFRHHLLPPCWWKVRWGSWRKGQEVKR